MADPDIINEKHHTRMKTDLSDVFAIFNTD